MVDYADTGVSPNASSSSASDVIRSNSFANESTDSVFGYDTATPPTLTNDNSINGGSGTAFALCSNHFNLNDIYGNTASGGSNPGLGLSGAVATTSTMTAEGAPYELQWMNYASLTVPSGVTLTIEPGVVVKGDPSGNNALNVNGTLDALGTATQPIVFTSLNDNTVGGTTGTGSPEAGDWGGINVSGSIDLERTVVDYADTGVSLNASSSSASDVIRSNSFANESTDSVFGYDTATPPTLTNDNSINGGSGTAFALCSNHFNLNDIYGNTASGGSNPGLGLSGAVATTSTMTAEGAPYELQWMDYASLTVPSGVTLTIEPGGGERGKGGGGRRRGRGGGRGGGGRKERERGWW